MSKIVASLFLFLFLFCDLRAQIKLTGRVFEQDSREALIGATVLLDKTNYGTSTNVDGEFELNCESLPVMLKISYLGFRDTLFTVDQQMPLEIALESFPIYGCYVILEESPIMVNLPAPIMQLNGKEIQRGDNVQLHPIFNRTPGLYMHSGALNTNRITLRGIGSRSPFATNKIRAYLDDIPLTNGGGETTLEDIDLSLIKKIQIWKGPTASIYGAGLGGMIHLKTSTRYKEDKNYFSNDFSLASFNRIRNSSIIGITGKKLELNFSYNLIDQESYRENNNYERSVLNTLAKYQINKKQELSFLVNHTSLYAEIPSSLNESDFMENPKRAGGAWGLVNGREDYERSLIGISHAWDIKDIGNYLLSNTSSLAFANKNGEEIRPFNNLEDSSNAFTLRSSFDFNKEKGKVFSDFSVGFEWYLEDYKWKTFESNEGTTGENLSENEEDRIYGNFFAQSYLMLTEKFSLLTGLNLNQTTYKYNDLFSVDGTDDSGNRKFDWVISPRLGLNYAFESEWSLFSSLSHGFSSPSIEETFTPDGAINLDLEPETGWNIEFGSRGKFNSRFSYEIVFFRTLVKNLLVQERISEDQSIGINAGETTHNGIETFMEYELLKRPNRITLFTSYSYADYKFKEFLNEEEDFSGNLLPGSPPHHLHFGLDAETNIGFYGNLNFQYVDAFAMRDDNSLFTDPYKLLNLKIGFYQEMNFLKKANALSANVYFGINNLLDEQYASMILINASSFGGRSPRYYYPGLPINYYGGLKLRYEF